MLCGVWRATPRRPALLTLSLTYVKTSFPPRAFEISSPTSSSLSSQTQLPSESQRPDFWPEAQQDARQARSLPSQASRPQRKRTAEDGCGCKQSSSRTVAADAKTKEEEGRIAALRGWWNRKLSPGLDTDPTGFLGQSTDESCVCIPNYRSITVSLNLGKILLEFWQLIFDF